MDRYGLAAGALGSRLLDARRWGIHANDLMLDVGSGQDPHPRANVLVDRFVDSNLERLCHASVVIDRPLFVADAARLPFASEAFDFVNCSHLLEHVSDPAGVVRELSRVARRGYVETPSPIYEKIWGWKFHRWFVSCERDRLVFVAKDKVIYDGELHGWFSTRMAERDFWWFFLTRLRRYGLLTSYLWNGDIPVEVRGVVNDEVPQFVSAAEPIVDEADGQPEFVGSTRPLKAALGRWLRRSSDSRITQALASLRCPRCHATIPWGTGSFSCSSCSAGFQRAGNVTVMLPELSGPVTA